MNEQNLLGEEQLNIDPVSAENLKETAKWAKFVAIAGFIFSAMIIIFAFYYYSQVTRYSFGRRYYSRYMLIAGVYIVIAIVWIITAVYQLRFSSRLTLALEANDQSELQQSFSNLKIYYRISGIITIVSLLLCFLGMLSLLGERSF